MSGQDKRQESIDLLNATHAFPCPFTFKMIGSTDGDFHTAVLEVFRDILDLDIVDDVPHSIRESSGGRHIAVTAEPTIDTAETVMLIYDRLREVPGLVMLM